MIAKFHITDHCNLRCPGCHWFSGPINQPGFIDVDLVIAWCRKHADPLREVRLTGGEPTLHPDFVRLANTLCTFKRVRIWTNGTNLEALRAVSSKCRLGISLNRPVAPEHLAQLRALPHRMWFQSFTAAREHNPAGARVLRDQLRSNSSNLRIGMIGDCLPSSIRFASDGHAYFCETGLRSKEPRLRCGFSLTEGVPSLTAKRCRIEAGCLSNIPLENRFKLRS